MEGEDSLRARLREVIPPVGHLHPQPGTSKLTDEEQPVPIDPAPTAVSTAIPLFMRFPQLQDEIPWLSLTRYPSPVKRLSRIGREVGHSHLWVKQDSDLGSEYGGNKIRKLEFILAEAKQAEAEEIIVMGGIGSHHVLASTLYARRLGLDVRAILFPQPATPHARDVLLAIFSQGAQVSLTPNRGLLIPHVIFHYLRRKIVRVTKTPFIVYPGGSSLAGCLGYVNAALELKQQIDRGELPPPGAIFVPLGSGGTMVGLLVGLALAGLSSQVIGVRVVESAVCNRYIVASLADRLLQNLKRFEPAFGRIRIIPDQIQIDSLHLGEGYGWPTPAAEKAIHLMRSREHISLEPTYTGKTLASLLDYAATQTGIPILFWNTFSAKPTTPLIKLKTKELPVEFRALVEKAR